MTRDQIETELQGLWDKSFPIEGRTKEMYDRIMELNKLRGNSGWSMTWDQYRTNAVLDAA